MPGKDVKISYATNLRFSQSKPDTRSSAKLSAPASLDWGKLAQTSAGNSPCSRFVEVDSQLPDCRFQIFDRREKPLDISYKCR